MLDTLRDMPTRFRLSIRVFRLTRQRGFTFWQTCWLVNRTLRTDTSDLSSNRKPMHPDDCQTCQRELIVPANGDDEDSFIIDGTPVKFCPDCGGRISGLHRQYEDLIRIQSLQMILPR